MSKFLMDTNLLMYYLVTNAKDRLYGYIKLYGFVFTTDLCLTELQKVVKLDVHTLASVEFGRDLENNLLFTILPRSQEINSSVYDMIEKYSMKIGETSKKKRKRDLSFADAELIVIAKELNLILLSNDSYILECAGKEGIQCNNPVLDLRNAIQVEDIYNPNLPTFKYL